MEEEKACGFIFRVSSIDPSITCIFNDRGFDLCHRRSGHRMKWDIETEPQIISKTIKEFTFSKDAKSGVNNATT